MRTLSYKILILGLLIGAPAWAKRVVYLAPISANYIIGGYDGSSSPKRYCEVDFSIREKFFGAVHNENRRTSGGNSMISISLRNISSISQTVTVYIEEVFFDSSYWQTDGIGNPDGSYKKYFNNGGSGYSITITLSGKQSLEIPLQIGCQGNATGNNCYMYQYNIVSNGVTLHPEKALFGIPAIYNATSTNATNYLCYKVVVQANFRLEVAEDKGSILGAISLSGAGPLGGGKDHRVSGSTDFRINGGRPF